MYKMNPFSTQNFHYVKGIAILAVILSHIGNYSGKTYFTPLGGIGVFIFLFCSGYGVMTSYYKNGINGYWKRKFITIWIPFALIEIISGILHQYAILDICLELLFLKVMFANGWYMQYLMFCYMSFYFGILVLPNTRIRFVVWGLFAVISFICLKNLQGEQALSFISGLAFAEFNNKRVVNYTKKQIVTGGVIAVFISIVFLIFRQLPWIRVQTGHMYTFLNIIFKGSFSIAIIEFATIWKPMKSTVLWISGISYYLYLIHGYFLFIVRENLFDSFYISSIVAIVLSFIFAFGFNKLLINMRRFLTISINKV